MFMTTTKELIKQYCEAGFWLILTNAEKKSVTPSWKENATVDCQEIEAHMKQYPEHNMAVYTGKSNLIVIDTDIKLEEGINGEENLQRFLTEQGLELPETLCVKTPRGGIHRYYRYEGTDLKPRINVIQGVDIRTGGSYVLLPPGKTQQGNYEWINGFKPERIAEVTEAVEWICKYEKPKSKKKVVKKTTTAVAVSNSTWDSKLPETIEEGNRNTELTKLVGSLIGKGMEEDEVVFYVKKANKARCNPPMEESEINSLLKSALKGFQCSKKEQLILPDGIREVFLTDQFDIEKAVKNIHRDIFVVQPNTEIILPAVKNDITIYPCGTKKLNDVLISKMELEDVCCSKLMWKAFRNKGLLIKGKETELDEAIQSILDIEEDTAIFQLGDTFIYEKDNCYYISTEKKDRQISNFVMKLLEYVRIENDAGITIGGEYVVEFIMQSKKKYQKRVSPQVFSSNRKFKEFLRADTIDLSYLGTESDIEFILQKMKINAKSLVEKTGIDYTGIRFFDNQWNYVGMEKTIDASGNVNESIVSVTEPTGSIYSDILDQDKILGQELEELLPHLFGMNVEEKMIGILGWCSANFCKERLKALGYKFPHLIVCGEAGSGKSSVVEELIQPLFSIQSPPLSCEKITQFAMLKACSTSNFFPVICEEYKPGRLGSKINMISGFLRDSYDGHGMRKGTSQQKVLEYQYRAPIILVGESGVDEKAVKDRSLEILFSISERQPLHTTHFQWLKQHQAVIQKMGRSMLGYVLQLEDNEILAIMEEKVNYFEQNTTFESRNKTGLAAVALGIEVLCRFSKAKGIDFEQVTNLDTAKVLDSLASLMNLSSSDGEGKTMTEVEKTIQVFDTMAMQGILESGIHYQVNRSTNELQLYIKDIYPLYSKFYRDYNMQAELDFLPKNQFSKQLRLTGYFKTHDKRCFQKTFNGNIQQSSNPKCFVLNLDMLEKAVVDLDRF